MFYLKTFMALVSSLGLLWMAGESLGGGEDKVGNSYIRVEARGKLKTGVVAIGGETTGTLLVTKDGKLELSLTAKKDLPELAEKLSGKDVVVTGTLTVRKGVETGPRIIVNVATLKAAD
jgi:cytochrome c-type biogenesis protein CcmE